MNTTLLKGLDRTRLPHPNIRGGRLDMNFSAKEGVKMTGRISKAPIYFESTGLISWGKSVEWSSLGRMSVQMSKVKLNFITYTSLMSSFAQVQQWRSSLVAFDNHGNNGGLCNSLTNAAINASRWCFSNNNVFPFSPLLFSARFRKKNAQVLNPIQKPAIPSWWTITYPISGVFSFHALAPGFCLLGRNDRDRSGGRNLHGPSHGSGHDGWYVSARALASCTLVVSVSGSKVVGLWDVQRICRDGGLRSHQCMWKGQWMEIFIASIGSFWKFALDMKRFLFQRCMGISSNYMMYEYIYIRNILQVLLRCLLLAPAFIVICPEKWCVWNSLRMEVFSGSTRWSIQHEKWSNTKPIFNDKPLPVCWCC